MSFSKLHSNSIIHSFLTNKGLLENADIILAEKDKKRGEKQLVRIFQDRYMYFVQRYYRTKPTKVVKGHRIESNKTAVEMFYKSFANHESIKALKDVT